MLIMTLGLGAAFVSVGIYFAFRWFARRSWKPFDGEVVSVRQSSGTDGFTYQPVIRVSIEGRVHEFESEAGSYPAPKVGQTRKVIGDPSTGQFAEFNLTILFLTVFLPVLAGFGVAFLGWSTYKTNENKPNKMPILTNHPPPVPAVMTATTSTPSRNRAPGQRSWVLLRLPR
jgi:ABC-type Fe3+ transport system permease subunit